MDNYGNKLEISDGRVGGFNSDLGTLCDRGQYNKGLSKCRVVERSIEQCCSHNTVEMNYRNTTLISIGSSKVDILTSHAILFREQTWSN